MGAAVGRVSMHYLFCVAECRGVYEGNRDVQESLQAGPGAGAVVLTLDGTAVPTQHHLTHTAEMYRKAFKLAPELEQSC